MRTVFRRTVVPSLTAALALLAAARLSADPPPPLTQVSTSTGRALLDEIVEEALARSPGLHALRDRLEAARARPAQARALPDPMLSLTYTNDGWSPSLGEMPMTTLALMGSQELPFPGKRGLRGDLASLAAAQAEQQLERGRLSVAASVRRAYYGLLESRTLVELIREQAALWGHVEALARTRYEVGQGVQQDVLRAQIEVTRAGQAEAAQVAEGRMRLAELNALLDRPAEAPLETSERLRLEPVAEPLPELLERLRGLSPELAEARLAVEAGGVAVSLAGKDFKPDFNVQAGYMNRGGLDPMWLAGVGVKLPVYRGRLHGAQAEAEARLRESERRLRAVDLTLRLRTQERLAQLEGAATIARLFDGGVIPQGRLSVEAAVAGYQAGRIPFVGVLEALNALYADRSAHVRVLATHARTRASLEEAGLEPNTETVSAAGLAATASSAAAPDAGASAMSGGMGKR